MSVIVGRGLGNTSGSSLLVTEGLGNGPAVAGIYVASAFQYAAATIRLTFNKKPLEVSSVGANDALNVSNYTVSGPELNAVYTVGSVVGSPNSVDLFLSGPLKLGVWTVTVANVQDLSGNALVDPRASIFTAAISISLESVNQGSVNDDAADILRKHLNPALKGKGWNALIKAIATGEQRNRDSAASAFDQLFLSTASGSYLQRKAGDNGVQRPMNLGMPDTLFRQYAIEYTNDKLTEPSLLKILEVFYGQEAVRASSTTGPAQPYAVKDQDTLNLLIDERIVVNVIFSSADFTVNGMCKSIEVAAAITRACATAGSNAYAVSRFDPQDGVVRVRIYSGSLGLGSSVRVTGGSAQNVLRFNTALDLIDGGNLPQWTVTVDTASGKQRWVGTAGFNAPQLQIGDYVNVYGNQFQPLNRGTFTITNVFYGYPSGSLVQFFEIVNPFGASEATTQTGLADVAFYRPIRNTIYSGAARSVIISQPAEEIDIVLPATSQAVGRSAGLAAYNQVNDAVAITALERVRGIVTATSTGHGLAVGDQIVVDGAYGTPVIPPIIAGDANATTSRSKGSIWATTKVLSAPYNMPYDTKIALMASGRVVIPAGVYITSGSKAISNGNFDYRQTSYVANVDGTYGVGFATDVLASVPAPVTGPGLSLGIQATPAFANNLILTGGRNTVPASTVYNYNEGSNTWSTMNAMALARSNHGQTTLASGKILVTGGISANNRATSLCEILDLTLTTPTWATAAPMAEPRCDHEQLLLSDGRVLVIGGRPLAQGYASEATTIGLYHFDGNVLDSSPNAFNLTLTGTATYAAGESGTAITPSNISSFLTTPNTGAAPTQLFNTFNGQKSWTVEFWCQGFPQGTLFEVNSSLGQDGTSASNVLICIGGFAGSVGSMNDSTAVMRLFVQTGSNFQVDQIISAGDFGGAIKFQANSWNHYAVVCRPSSMGGSNIDYLLYLNGTLSVTLSNLPPGLATGPSTYRAQFLHSVTTATSGAQTLDEFRISNVARPANGIYYDYQVSTGETDFPSYDRIGRVLSTCEIYDPNTNTWSQAGGMSKARVFHKAVLLPNDNVLVIGGLGYDPSQNSQALAVQALVDCEIWTPGSNTWYPAGATAYKRDSLIARYLPSRNQIIVAGGSYTTATEIYDLNTRTWSIGSAKLPGLIHRGLSRVLGTDEILLIGGYDPVTLTSNQQPLLYVPNNDLFMAGSLNGPRTVSAVPSTSTFQYLTPDQVAYTLMNVSGKATFTSFKQKHTAVKGPFMWNPNDGVAVTGVEATIQAQLDQGHQYAAVTVDDATIFPDSAGWLVFSFGFQEQVAPVRYYGLLSNTQLALDYSFKFSSTVKAGSKVTLLAQKGPYAPDPLTAATVGSFYLTDSASGRIAASTAIDGAVAAGVKVVKTVVYPGDRGLGGEGLPASGTNKVSDKVRVWGSDSQDHDMAVAEGRE